ncbi:MAG: glycosyltransferase family 9 protein [Acidobacteria bacterium]|nr:glycosyltransferase family 9 protein [Acidobacteriota bacterium]
MTGIKDIPLRAALEQGLAALRPGARVLVIRLRSLGDTVLLTPALRLLHDWRPDLEISVLVERPWNQLLEGNPTIHTILTAESKLATAWRVRRARYEAVINLHGGPTSAWLTRISGAHLRAGFTHFRSGSAYTHRVPTAQEILGRQGPVHTAEHVASCFFWLGVPMTAIPRAEVYPSQLACERVGERLRSFGIGPGEGYAVIHPTALYETKQWKAGGFAEVSEYLEDGYGLRSIFVCGETEVRALDAVERHAPRPLLRAAGWPIRDLVALIAGARVMVGNDSGPAHIAAAARIPVVLIFGSSHSAVWSPWKAVESAVVQNYFDCNPCPGDRCYAFAEPRCILSITSEQVKVCLDAILGPRPHARS